MFSFEKYLSDFYTQDEVLNNESVQHFYKVMGKYWSTFPASCQTVHVVYLFRSMPIGPAGTEMVSFSFLLVPASAVNQLH